MLTPGATISGLMRPESSAFTGPRLLKSATFPNSSIAPTEKAESYKDNGASTVLQSGPSFPVETTTKIPAARKLSEAAFSEFASQPSISGQPHELFSTSAARSGSPSTNGSQSCGKGASMNCIQSRYSAGLARLRTRLAHANQVASGAMPIPFWPTIVPRSEEHTSELQSRLHLVCRLLLEKKKK